VKTYDAVVIGAGSVGLCCAVSLCEKKLKVLVIDELPSHGQGQNKAAIGGIRATHSDPAKIKVSLRSIAIFSRWKETRGDDIGWRRGGYVFTAHSETEAGLLRAQAEANKKHGLNIVWADAASVRGLVPGINLDGLLGGTYSADDGSASPLLAAAAFKRRAEELGAEFRFGEKVTGFKTAGGKLSAVLTDKGVYPAPTAIVAAGASAKEVCALAGISVPVSPDSHEAAITEPLARMFEPLVVDMRQDENSQNFYFYQNSEGQIVFCLTPKPPVWGNERRSSSGFLSAASKRLVDLMPALARAKVRRVWRGLYPMTPDGFPMVEKFSEPEGLILAGGMCGQGFMLGPGTGELAARLAAGETTPEDEEILKSFSTRRNFTGTEKFK